MTRWLWEEVMLRFDHRDIPVARMRDAVRVAKRAAAGLGVKPSR